MDFDSLLASACDAVPMPKLPDKDGAAVIKRIYRANFANPQFPHNHSLLVFNENDEAVFTTIGPFRFREGGFEFHRDSEEVSIVPNQALRLFSEVFDIDLDVPHSDCHSYEARFWGDEIPASPYDEFGYELVKIEDEIRKVLGDKHYNERVDYQILVRLTGDVVIDAFQNWKSRYSHCVIDEWGFEEIRD